MRGRALAALAGMATLTGCSSSTSTLLPYTPYVGLSIDSASLVAPYGCGTGPTEVYRYLATVTFIPDDAGTDAASAVQTVATGLFDCFADGVFESLPSPPATFWVNVYAFSMQNLPASFTCDASPCVPPALDAGASLGSYQWTTSCTATEESGAAVVANCKPLAPVAARTADAAP